MTEERPEIDPEEYETALKELSQQLQTAVTEIDVHELVCVQMEERFDHYSWVGIYVVEGDELILSAWSGPEETEHTRIGVGEGICGLAARTGETEIVPDVAAREEFIACFPSTKSEIVVPIHSKDGTVIGEIDIDSDWLDAFDERDRDFLETVAAQVAEVMETTG
ncbi:MAG TPA: GAF domain-containing protein [Gemmatimonadota bacterium]|nr:GAF domain-containing protein [Gemmatimonadota bacterium]